MTATGARVSVRQKMTPAPFRGRELRRLVEAALPALSVTGCDLRILVVGDPEMARWNMRFLGHEGTTNVISFPEDDPPREGLVAERLAGDILVSAPTCLRETEGWRGSPEERVFYYIVHGMLHLLGYDHLRGKAEARRMRRIEMKTWLAATGREGM